MHWDYLVLTASNHDQAIAYETQLALRRQLGLLPMAGEARVIADPGGRRVGSGGSTLYCLARILGDLGAAPDAPGTWFDMLRGLHILIVHAGGDSKRLPAYGPCGKLFVPLPGQSDSALPQTLFDRQIKTYASLPPPGEGAGQVVITSGDVLLDFDPGEISFAPGGIVGLGCLASPEEASAHGVYCTDSHGVLQRFLQKPPVAEQRKLGAVDPYGQTILDIGVIHFDAATAVALMEIFETSPCRAGELPWTAGAATRMLRDGLDFYREICCSLGGGTTAGSYVDDAMRSGSAWPAEDLTGLFARLNALPASVALLSQCSFLHFGTSRQLISSGEALLQKERFGSRPLDFLDVNNHFNDNGRVAGGTAWIEGCRIAAELELGGGNVVVGADIARPVVIGRGGCVDVVAGSNPRGEKVHFVRCYGTGDGFKESVADGATFCNMPIAGWLASAGLAPEDVWGADYDPAKSTLWEAGIFPCVDDPADFDQWLWMHQPAKATAAQRAALKAAERYSLADIARLTDQKAFYMRRQRIRGEEIQQSLPRLFHGDSNFSSRDLAHILSLADAARRSALVADLLVEMRRHCGLHNAARPRAIFTFSRISHTLGDALAGTGTPDTPLLRALPGIDRRLDAAHRQWLEKTGIGIGPETTLGQWLAALRAAAFEMMSQTIITSREKMSGTPRNALRRDEIVWGRSPARLDFGGGWADTPPYSLENGGCVINAAIDLNGQPPIHCYGRVIPEPVIRIGSIDLGARIEISDLDSLLDYRSATSEFGLAKAALALSGFAPELAGWEPGATLRGMLEQFGGGIELTTLAAIPKGSGLGTSSIVGAVILAVIARIMGHKLSHREVFQGVMRLEQALTTGGGWQDQVGGALPAVKVVRTQPGLTPDASVHFVPADVLDPDLNQGVSLLYYTGITRLAKNVLQQVVGRYLDRNRATLETLRRIHNMPPRVADAMSRKDIAAFGRLVGEAWEQNKALDPNSTNPEIERIMELIAPHVHGAKLTGAGGGGFMMIVCKSPADAATVRTLLDRDPPNQLARFFGFSINRIGLEVTVC